MFNSLIDAIGSVATFAVAILAVWLFFKLLNLPLKIFFKLLWNAIIGAVILVALNLVLGLFSFTIPITIVNALVVGLFGTVGVLAIVVLWLVNR